MSPHQAYRFYLAIKLHFTKESYDVFETRGAVVSQSAEDFERDRKRGRFAAIAREHSTPKEVVQFFVACFAYGVDIFDPQASYDAHLKWVKHKEMMTSLILDELDSIDEIEPLLEGAPCKLMKMISGNHISIETAVALNRKLNFIDSWKSNFTHPTLYIRIKKLDRFISFNEEKVFRVVTSKMHEEMHT